MPDTTSPRRIVATSAAFGLVTGWLDLALVTAWKALDPRIPMGALRTNRHALWMVPVSDLLVFTAVGVLLAVVARARPAVVKPVAWRALTGLAALALLFDVRGLHAGAALALAAGIGVRFGPLIESAASRRPALARRGSAALGAALVVWAVLISSLVFTAERRALASLPVPKGKTPNVLVVVLDNVRAESMSLYGRDRPTTPRLDQLAKGAVVFDHARSPSSWTLASHASLMTGQWCHDLEFGFDRALDASPPTLAEALSASGYATAGFVANTYYCNEIYGLGRGFARYEDHYENLAVTPFEVARSTALGQQILYAVGFKIRVDQAASVRKTAEMLNRDLLGWIDGRPKDRPFFAFVNYFDAHAPFVAPDGPDPRFGLASLPAREKTKILKQGLNAPATDDATRRAKARAVEVAVDSYESCLAYLDRYIGLLFDQLDRRGLRDDTIIVVTSDHGEHFAERGFMGHGLSLYKPEVHVPLLVFLPGRSAKGVRVDAPVSLRDVAATVVEQAGVSGPFPGQSLARFWDPNRPGDPSPVLSEVRHQTSIERLAAVPASLGIVHSLLHGDRIYFRNADGREELYDLVSDPKETKNLAAEPAHASAVDTYRRHLDRHVADEPPVMIARDPKQGGSKRVE